MGVSVWVSISGCLFKCVSEYDIMNFSESVILTVSMWLSVSNCECNCTCECVCVFMSVSVSQYKYQYQYQYKCECESVSVYMLVWLSGGDNVC